MSTRRALSTHLRRWLDHFRIGSVKVMFRRRHRERPRGRAAGGDCMPFGAVIDRLPKAGVFSERRNQSARVPFPALCAPTLRTGGDWLRRNGMGRTPMRAKPGLGVAFSRPTVSISGKKSLRCARIHAPGSSTFLHPKWKPEGHVPGRSLSLTALGPQRCGSTVCSVER